MAQIDGREYQFANLIDRYFANLIDGLITGTLFILGILVLRQLDWFSWATILVLIFTIFVVYFTWPVSNFAQTAGFKIMDIRVIKTDGTNLGFFRVFLRYVLAIVLGSVFPTFNRFEPERQLSHDLIVGSIVVEKTPELEPGLNYSKAIKRTFYTLFYTVFLVLSIITFVVVYGPIVPMTALLIILGIPLSLFVIIVVVYVILIRQALDDK